MAAATAVKQGQQWQRWQQWLWQWQTVKETAGEGKNEKIQQAARVAAETAAVAVVILAVWQSGKSDKDESSGNSNKHPLLLLAMVRDDER
jgi:hypothetical protein